MTYRECPRASGTWSPPSRLPSVSVLIPTFRYASKISRTVRAVLADPAATEVIVVVDGCRDGSLEVVNDLRAQDDRVVPVFVEHGGKSAALAAGLTAARGEVCLLLDQDVLAGPGLVTGHARHHLWADHLVVVGYMPTVGDAVEREVPLLSALYAHEYESHCETFEADPGTVLRELWGGNVSIRTADCRHVGVDFRYFGHEDKEFGIRCLEAGLTGRFDRSLYAQHRHSRDATSFLWYSKMQGASRWLLHRDHPGVLGPFHPDLVLGGMPPMARALAHLLATPAVGERSAVLTVRLGDLAAGAGWRGGQVLAYRFARRVVLRTGVLLAMAGREADLQVRPMAPGRARREGSAPGRAERAAGRIHHGGATP